jgi:DNA-binding NtrC family response regulator
MKVLVVDDERSIRETLKDILEEEGYEVEVEENGSSALKRIETSPPDLIILDLFLPGMAGMELLKKLNDKGITKRIPIIIVSGHGTVETAVKAMKLGAFDFLEKPIKYETFLNAVDRALRRDEEMMDELPPFFSYPLRRARDEFEKLYIKSVLKRFNNDLRKAAAFMEIDISNLYRKLNKYGLDKERAS